jgi:hypothetical protein
MPNHLPPSWIRRTELILHKTSSYSWTWPTIKKVKFPFLCDWGELWKVVRSSDISKCQTLQENAFGAWSTWHIAVLARRGAIESGGIEVLLAAVNNPRTLQYSAKRGMLYVKTLCWTARDNTETTNHLGRWSCYLLKSLQWPEITTVQTEVRRLNTDCRRDEDLELIKLKRKKWGLTMRMNDVQTQLLKLIAVPWRMEWKLCDEGD